jgi:hypothetical protein
MMEWKRFKDELPPVGKRVLVTRPSLGGEIVSVASLLYVFGYEEDKNRNNFTLGATKEMIEASTDYWLEFPEPPIKGE